MAFHPAIQQMLNRYQIKSKEGIKNALKEVIQEVALLGLARQNFFDKAAFYGGTALRIAHRLNRFSEDLDFELLRGNNDFKLENYLNGIDDELKSFGLNLKSERKVKSVESAADSAFIKGNTLEHLLMIQGLQDPKRGFNKNDVIKIKLEIDLNPPETHSSTEILVHEYPIFFSYRILDLPSLFAGKLHAVLCREWKGERIKGRDFYDFLWYVARGISPNLPYLESKMRQSENLNETLTREVLIKRLETKFEKVNWELAKRDVAPFIKDEIELSVWNEAFFKRMANRMP
ncbi:MAG: nucleotidyl transferase AbiEii/AbiGii toxin family protein [Bacteriovoracia bacterium]